MNGIDFGDEYLARLWDETDWKATEARLAEEQRRLTLAAYRGDEDEIRHIQIRIVRDIGFKCLAVKHVADSAGGPGVDGVKWTTSAEKMRAAMSLTSKDYHAMPMRLILLKNKNSGKERRAGLPTYRDRAMQVLYGYSLLPVSEAHAERKSFAFRSARSTLDVHAYIMEMFKGRNAPSIAVITDITACYSHIQHSWLLAHAPMDRKVLAEFLAAGLVFAGELFPADGEGISEGANLSPYLANLTLDGLQKHIFNSLNNGETPTDYTNGDMIRFADDVIVSVRTREDAERVLESIREFLAVRGLSISEKKTVIASIDDGFTFLSRTYIRKNGIIYSYPSEEAVESCIAGCKEIISTGNKSQRALIKALNSKLKGWASYHKYTDATDAFKRVDTAVNAALLEAAFAKHPKMQRQKVIAKYWYKEADGRHVYALPDDKSVRLVRLEDTILLNHNRIKTNANPFLEPDYIEYRTHNSEIQNVTGPYKAVWLRQGGTCYYCGRPILSDQPRTVVPLDLSKVPSPRNSAYIHKMCVRSEFQVVHTMENVDEMTPYDVMQALESVQADMEPKERIKHEIGPKWKHIKFKQYLAGQTAASITLTFKQIEEIDGRPLPASARSHQDWWYPRPQCNMIAEAWLTEGYRLEKLDLKKEKITLKREMDGVARLVIPKQLTDKKIPIDAKYELETHMEYIIKKYGL